jgi:prevent-host-death family protein
METIAISKFKATCLAVLERVRLTGEPVLVTRFGEPVAEVVPPPTPGRPRKWLGSFRERGEIIGDVVSPATSEDEWDALKP